MFLNTFQQKRDPNTGWRYNSTGADGTSHCIHVLTSLLSQNVLGTQLTREHALYNKAEVPYTRVQCTYLRSAVSLRSSPCRGGSLAKLLFAVWEHNIIILLVPGVLIIKRDKARNAIYIHECLVYRADEV